jgi:leucine dehydrogenase
MESLLRAWDGENVILRFDQLTKSWIIIAIHSTRLGPAVGGTRMKPYADATAALRDAMRLAEGMTYKFAVPDTPYGGGKAVIAIPRELAPEMRADLLRRYGALVRQLGGLYFTAPDLGTSSADMDVIAETGAPYVFARTAAAGGAGSSGPATALGVFAGIQTACERVFGSTSVEGRRVLVQGVGSVGAVLIERLQAAGAKVLFSDVNDRQVRRFRDELGLEFVHPRRVYETACDVLAPCALGGVLSAETIPRLECRVVAGGANNQLAEPEDAERLRARGIVYAPDYVVNVGGALAGIGMEVQGWTRDEAETRVTATVMAALKKVFELADEEGVSTSTAALRLAKQRLGPSLSSA